MPETKSQIQPIARSARFVSDTFNAADNTIELIAATESEVLQRSWDVGFFNEVLSMKPEHIRMDRLKTANLLDNHDMYSSVGRCILGAIDEVSVSGSELKVKVRFSDREDVKPIISDVKNKITKNVSVKYRVYAYEITEEVGKIPTYRAIDWEPLEVSFVAVPADYNAMARSETTPSNEVIFTNSLKNRNMPEVTKPAEPTPPVVDPQRAADPAPVAPADDSQHKAGFQSAKKRSSDILTAVRAAGFDADFAQTLIDDDTVTVDKARQLIIEKLAEGQAPAQRSVNMTIVGDDETVKERKAIEYAVLHRAAPGMYPLNVANNQDSTLAANYRGISILAVAFALLNQRGIKVNAYNKQEVYERSMSTSDFPNLMAAVANKILRREYTETPQTFKVLANQQNLPDFKETSVLQFGGDAKFEEVKEGAEIKYGSFTESKDGWKLSTYAKIFKLSRQMIINDDLNAFARIGRLIARGARNNESKLFWDMIINNVKLADGKTLFHADHGNLAGSGAVLSATTMSAARTAMRRQKGLTSEEYIDVVPKFLVVSPEVEMAADQLLTNITPNQSGQVNPFTAAGLTKIVEPRLSANPWYVFADPAMIDLFTYGYLEGAEGLFTENRFGFEVDGLEIKARTDFGVKCWDYRGTYKNPGA